MRLPRLPARAYRVSACVLAALTTAGCYTYQTPLAGPPAPGSDVRAVLSTEAMIRMEPLLGESRRALEGELVGLEESRLLLLTRTAASAAGSNRAPVTGPPPRQRVILDLSEVLTLEERQLDLTRTVGLSVLGVAVAGFLLYRAFVFEPGGDTFGLPPGGPEMQRALPRQP